MQFIATVWKLMSQIQYWRTLDDELPLEARYLLSTMSIDVLTPRIHLMLLTYCIFENVYLNSIVN